MPVTGLLYLYMFRALLAHPQEPPHKQLVCGRLLPVAVSNTPTVYAVPPEDVPAVLETCIVC
jgi:hypothetical protein